VSDVVVAAAIAAGVGLLGTAATLTVTRWNIKDQAHQRTEEAKGAARQNRRESYGELAWLLLRLRKYHTLGYPPSHDDWSEWLDQYAYGSGVVLIVATPAVGEAVDSFSAALATAARELREAADGRGSWADAYSRYAPELDEQITALLERMRTDVAPD